MKKLYMVFIALIIAILCTGCSGTETEQKESITDYNVSCYQMDVIELNNNNDVYNLGVVFRAKHAKDFSVDIKTTDRDFVEYVKNNNGIQNDITILVENSNMTVIAFGFTQNGEYTVYSITNSNSLVKTERTAILFSTNYELIGSTITRKAVNGNCTIE